ncbi:MAG: DUF5689 domain-containing protein [Alistipes sp.]
MRQIVGISLIMWLIATACNTSSTLSFEENATHHTSIAQLKSYCHGTSTLLTHELTLRGIVTANDLRGELSHTLIIEDRSGGVEIAIDHPALADLFPLGSVVTVYCTGLAVGNYGGKIMLGAAPTSTYCVDRIARTEIDRYLRCTAPDADLRRPQSAHIADLGADDIDRYLHFEQVRFVEADRTWCERDTTGALVATQRTLIDAHGATLPVRTLPSCHYATEPLPQGKGSVNGIIGYFNGELSLRIINYEINFTVAATPPTTYP